MKFAINSTRFFISKQKLVKAFESRKVFLQYALRDPLLIMKNAYYKGKWIVKHNKQKHVISPTNTIAQKILLEGVMKIEMDAEGLKLIGDIGKRFSKLIGDEKFIQKPDPERINTLSYGKVLFVFNGSWRRFYPEIPYLVEKNMGDILRSYFGKDYEIIAVEMAKKKYLPKDFFMKDAFSNFWHFDFRRQDTSWLLILLNLNDHSEEEAFHTFDLQTSAEALKKGLYGRYSPEDLPEELKDKRVIVGSGPAGTCHIANAADMLHRSGDISLGKDRDVAFIFVTADVHWPTVNGFKDSPLQTIDTVSVN